MQKYAFIDKDGTIIWEPPQPPDNNPDKNYTLTSMKQFKFIDGAIEGLRTLVEKGYRLVLATNQAYLGTPNHPRELFDQVMIKINNELAKYNIAFDFVMVCPHGPEENCVCRKPKIGGLKPFIEASKGKIDFDHSLMFGDRSDDEGFANNLGIRFVFVKRNEQFVLPKDI
jgi:imidazoleglycerol-phosphate dehydratase/histidinol-phosphatase